MTIIRWNKKYTETLAEMLKRFRRECPEYKDEKITYAGRLDPMAEGLVILLTGNDVYKKEELINFDKVYEVDFIFGISTDTYDILGLINEENSFFDNEINDSKIFDFIHKKIGKYQQAYPPYSSKTVDGKPLFEWAREEKIDNIVIPTKEVNIYNIDYLGKRTVSIDFFKKQINDDISRVEGDFRQEVILKKWKSFFRENSSLENINIYSMKIYTSSGTYIRTLIHELSIYLEIPACSVKIKRIKIGPYSL